MESGSDPEISYILQTSPEQRVVLDTSKWENASLRMLRKHIAHGSIGHCIVQVLFYQACGFELKGSFEVEHYELGPLPRMYTLVRQGGKAE